MKKIEFIVYVFCVINENICMYETLKHLFIYFIL